MKRKTENRKKKNRKTERENQSFHRGNWRKLMIWSEPLDSTNLIYLQLPIVMKLKET